MIAVTALTHALTNALTLAKTAIENGESFDYLDRTVYPALCAALEDHPPRTPVLWYHPTSGRIRLNGSRLPPSWIPLYKD